MVSNLSIVQFERTWKIQIPTSYYTDTIYMIFSLKFERTLQTQRCFRPCDLVQKPTITYKKGGSRRNFFVLFFVSHYWIQMVNVERGAPQRFLDESWGHARPHTTTRIRPWSKAHPHLIYPISIHVIRSSQQAWSMPRYLHKDIKICIQGQLVMILSHINTFGRQVVTIITDCHNK